MNTVPTSTGKASAPTLPGVLLSVPIESKLGLGPCDRRDSKPKPEGQAAPAKRARLRRQTQRM